MVIVFVLFYFDSSQGVRDWKERTKQNPATKQKFERTTLKRNVSLKKKIIIIIQGVRADSISQFLRTWDRHCSCHSLNIEFVLFLDGLRKKEKKKISSVLLQIGWRCCFLLFLVYLTDSSRDKKETRKFQGWTLSIRKKLRFGNAYFCSLFQNYCRGRFFFIRENSSGPGCC